MENINFGLFWWLFQMSFILSAATTIILFFLRWYSKKQKITDEISGLIITGVYFATFGFFMSLIYFYFTIVSFIQK